MIPTIITVSVLALGVIIFFISFNLRYVGKKGKPSPEEKAQISEAAKLLKLAQKGDGEAYYKLYLLYKQNALPVNFSSEYTERRTYLKKSADLGYPKAQYEYGKSRIYSDDCSVAVAYLEKAASAGVTDAASELARIYDSAAYGYKFRGLERFNKLTARKLQAKWLQVVAETGDAEEQVSLGYLYFYDLDDKRSALEWFEKAAAQGNGRGLTGAARIYQARGGYEKALKYFTAAAEGGYSGGMYWLGRFYLEDYAFDKEKALFWLNKAAESGRLQDTPAMDYLAKLYEDGGVVEADHEKAQYWRDKIKAVREAFKKRNDETEKIAEKDLSED